MSILNNLNVIFGSIISKNNNQRMLEENERCRRKALNEPIKSEEDSYTSLPNFEYNNTDNLMFSEREYKELTRVIPEYTISAYVAAMKKSTGCLDLYELKDKLLELYKNKTGKSLESIVNSETYLNKKELVEKIIDLYDNYILDKSNEFPSKDEVINYILDNLND